MKRVFTAVLTLVVIICMSWVCAAQDAAFMGLSATGDWHIFSKNMENKELLDAVDMSAREINEILENTRSESMFVNAKTNAVICVKVDENDKSKELWNISETEDSYLLQNLNSILHNGFSMHDLDYKAENVRISTVNPDFKQIIIPGSTDSGDGVHGMIVSGTFLNGKTIAFVMETRGETPTEEEIAELEEVTKGVEITNIRQKGEEEDKEASKPINYTRYLIGGAIVVIVAVFAFAANKKSKRDDEEEGEEEDEE